MKIGNARTTFTILLTTEDRNMLGTNQLVMDINKDGVDEFIRFYRVNHPHAKGERVSILSNSTDSKHPYRILLTKTSSSGKWKHLNTLPVFSPETVSLSADEKSGHDPWIASRPAMQRVAPQATARRAKALPEATLDKALVDTPTLEKVLPKVPAQIMTREEYSETAMYKSLMDGMALVNKAMAFYGERLVIEQRNGRLVALVEVTGD